jgi:hypothetical protein
LTVALALEHGFLRVIGNDQLRDVEEAVLKACLVWLPPFFSTFITQRWQISPHKRSIVDAFRAPLQRSL